MHIHNNAYVDTSWFNCSYASDADYENMTLFHLSDFVCNWLVNYVIGHLHQV